MFETLFAKLKSLFDKILPNFDWKKMAWAAGAGVVTFLLLAFVVHPILSLWWVYVIGAIAVGYLVYTRVAMWEIQKLIDGAKDVFK